MINYRDITPADSAMLQDLKMKVIPACLSHHTADDVEKWLDYCRQEDALSCFAKSTGFVALHDDKAVGFVVYIKGEAVSSINSVFSLMPRTTNRIGENLLRRAEEQIYKDNENTRISLRATLNAVDFYKKYGYQFKEHTTSRAGFPIQVLEK